MKTGTHFKVTFTLFYCDTSIVSYGDFIGSKTHVSRQSPVKVPRRLVLAGGKSPQFGGAQSPGLNTITLRMGFRLPHQAALTAPLSIPSEFDFGTGKACPNLIVPGFCMGKQDDVGASRAVRPSPGPAT